MKKLKKLFALLVLSFIALFSFGPMTNLTYAANGDANTASAVNKELKDTGSKQCDRTLKAALSHFGKGIRLDEVFQCGQKGAKQNTILKLFTAIMDYAVFPILLGMLVYKMFVKGGQKAASSMGSGFGSSGGGGSGLSEGLKNFMSERSGEIAGIILILAFWQMGALDLILFFLRVVFGTAANDIGGEIEVNMPN